jgi:LPXTG-motif cell wall-anchored protein
MRIRNCAALFVLLALGTLPASSIGTAFASHDGDGSVVGGFEIDGDFAYPHDPALPGATLDWASAPHVLRIDDLSGSQDDDAFVEGSKEEEPDGWTFEDHKSPGKDDLTRIYAASSVRNGAALLWLGFERLEIEGQGDAHVNFELNQKTSTVVNGEGTTIPERSEGDLLVVYDYPGGDEPVEIEVRTWKGDALSGSWEKMTLPAGSVVADVNASEADRPDDDPFGGGSVQRQRFGEVGLDLSAIFADSSPCPRFASYWAKSRASGESFDAQLKDVVAPQEFVPIAPCGLVRLKKVDDLDQPLGGASFKLWQGSKDRVDPESERTCVTDEDGICSFEGLRPGLYWLQETEAPAGYRFDPTVHQVRVEILTDMIAVRIFENRLVLGSVEVLKKDSSGKLVPGISFIAYRDANGNGAYNSGEQATRRDGSPATCRTGSGGACTIEGLVPGTYRLHEDPKTVPATMETAPDVAVTVKPDATVEVTFVNPLKASPPPGPKPSHKGDLPKTGIDGTALFGLAGALLAAGTTFAFAGRRILKQPRRPR